MAAAAGVTDEGTLIFSAWPDTCTAVNEVQKGPEQEEIDNFCCSEGTTNTLGVFPQTEAVWALGKEDLCVHLLPAQGKGTQSHMEVTKISGGHIPVGQPPAASQSPNLCAQTLAVGSGVILQGPGWRPAGMLLHKPPPCWALDSWLHQHGHTTEAPCSLAMSTLLLAVPQFYVTSQVTSTPCISVPLPKIFLTHISFEAAAGLLGAICRANPQLIPSSGAAAMKYRLRDLRHFQIWS